MKKRLLIGLLSAGLVGAMLPGVAAGNNSAVEKVEWNFECPSEVSVSWPVGPPVVDPPEIHPRLGATLTQQMKACDFVGNEVVFK